MSKDNTECKQLDFKGCKAWYLKGKAHRTDGPAVEYDNGTKVWYLKGELHREDGPALEHSDGSKQWLLNNKEYAKPEYYKELFHRGLLTEEELFTELLD